MREKEEREGLERGGRKGGEKGATSGGHQHGCLQRLDKETTSFYFTNFPEEVKAMELWREVRDAKDILRRMEDMWVVTYKLRINLSRFEIQHRFRGSQGGGGLHGLRGLAYGLLWLLQTKETWLRCSEVPLHVWGEALFRAPAFKFGSFLKVDESTKQMLRGDVARVLIETSNCNIIDSTMKILVQGQNFLIRVIEEGGGWAAADQWHNGEEYVVQRENALSMASADGASNFAAVEGFSQDG
ncbi:DUF4283 domain protein [Trifolium medium]|uniref:DUF4283 domain protein n=1 Tax=Trifolium medium TaxID=97028 RepID=A0A392LZN7_9FABA|nr:DUF4283 domain protein [Trifolium medium]